MDFDFDINANVDRPYQIFGQTQPAAYNVSSNTSQLYHHAGRGPQREHPQLAICGNQSVTVGVGIVPTFSPPTWTFPSARSSYGSGRAAVRRLRSHGRGTLGFAILSDIEAYFFIQAAQGDKRSNILQAPKVTLFNGQQAFVSEPRTAPS